MAAAAAAWALAAHGAVAQEISSASVLDLLEDVCVRPDARADEALAAARAAGFMTPPPEFARELQKLAEDPNDDLAITGATSMLKLTEGGLLLMFVGTAAEDKAAKGALKGDMCMIGAMAAVPDFGEAVPRWLGPGAKSNDPKDPEGPYLFLNEPRGRKMLTGLSDEAIETMARTQPVRAVFFEKMDEGGMVAYFALRP